jgi:hypothetical protein
MAKIKNKGKEKKNANVKKQVNNCDCFDSDVCYGFFACAFADR